MLMPLNLVQVHVTKPRQQTLYTFSIVFFFAANKGLEIIWGQFLIQTDFFLSIFLSSFQLFQ